MIWTGLPSLRGVGRFVETRRLLSLVLIGALVWSVASVGWGDGVIHTGGSDALKAFILGLFPPEISPDFLKVVVAATWQTLVHAVAAITLAIVVGLPLGIVASGALGSPGRARLAVAGTFRFGLAVMRSIHELVWAMLFVTAFGLSSITVVLAIAIPYAGILGQIYSELLNDVPDAPLAGLRSSGASPARVLLYGRISMVFTDILGYTFYRFECALRAAAIMSFVGIRGLGFEIQMSLHDLRFNEVWTLLLVLVGLVLLVDYWSGRVRRNIQS